MSSTLSAVPVEKRRRLAGVLGLFAVLLLAVGAVALTGDGSGLITTFVVVSFVAALVLAVLAWGVATSVHHDLLAQAGRRHEAAVDDALADALAEAVASGDPAVREFTAQQCGCGHEHDPDEMHVVGDPCAHDGGGDGCSRTCDTCVLSRLQGAPPVAGADRPAPRPRPTPSGRG